MAIATVNPATGETLKTYDALDAEAIERRLAAAETAFRTHRTTSTREKGLVPVTVVPLPPPKPPPPPRRPPPPPPPSIWSRNRKRNGCRMKTRIKMAMMI